MAAGKGHKQQSGDAAAGFGRNLRPRAPGAVD
jgi:hypothetical protein